MLFSGEFRARGQRKPATPTAPAGEAAAPVDGDQYFTSKWTVYRGLLRALHSFRRQPRNKDITNKASAGEINTKKTRKKK